MTMHVSYGQKWKKPVKGLLTLIIIQTFFLRLIFPSLSHHFNSIVCISNIFAHYFFIFSSLFDHFTEKLRLTFFFISLLVWYERYCWFNIHLNKEATGGNKEADGWSCRFQWNWFENCFGWAYTDQLLESFCHQKIDGKMFDVSCL